MVKEPNFEFTVELDDDDLNVSGGSSFPCGLSVASILISTVTQCFDGTAVWGSCRLGTRGCC